MDTTATIETDVGARVKAGRAARRMKQAELAEALGMRRARLSAIESGRVNDIRASEMRAFNRILLIPLDAWGRDAETETNAPRGEEE